MIQPLFAMPVCKGDNILHKKSHPEIPGAMIFAFNYSRVEKCLMVRHI